MKNNQHKTLDDIIFENRNKDYGAYYNRMTASQDLLKSLGVGILGIGIFALALSFSPEKENEKPLFENGIHDIIDLPPDPEKKIEVNLLKNPPSKPKIIKSEVTESDIPPTPTKNAEIETPIKDNEDLGQLTSPDGDSTEGNNNIITSNDFGGNDGNDNPAIAPKPEIPEKKEYFVKDVAKMAIFPGCEKFENNKDKAIKCISEKLQNELATQLRDFEDTANRFQIKEAIARIQFIINKKGEIIEVKAIKGGNQELSQESKEAIERIARKMVHKKQYIKPAEFSDGTAVNLVFTIPIKYDSKN